MVLPLALTERLVIRKNCPFDVDTLTARAKLFALITDERRSVSVRTLVMPSHRLPCCQLQERSDHLQVADPVPSVGVPHESE